MGMNVIPLKDLTPDETKTMTLSLLKNMDANDSQNDKDRGQIMVELTYKPFKEDELPKDFEDNDAAHKVPEGTPPGGGVLMIIVHEAQDVEGKHHTNPYVKILFKGEERKTKVQSCLFFLAFIGRSLDGNTNWLDICDSFLTHLEPSNLSTSTSHVFSLLASLGVSMFSRIYPLLPRVLDERTEIDNLDVITYLNSNLPLCLSGYAT